MKDFFYKRSVPIHLEIKDELIRAINSTPQLYIDEYNGNFYTDYVVSNILVRDYAHIVNPILSEHIDAFKMHCGFKEMSLVSAWFQKYPVGGFHPEHVHPESHFTNIYYVKLENKSCVTTVLNPLDKSKIEIEINEGDILTFPAFYPHSSPVADSEKIIVAFNTNVI